MADCKAGSSTRKSQVKVPQATAIPASGELLLQAVKSGNEVMTRKLISLGVPVDFKDQFGCGPIYYAARYNHLNILKILVECDAFVNASSLMKRTALQIASYHGHVNCVQYLIDMQAKINDVDGLGMSALHWAAENNHKKTVEILLKSEADTKLVNKFGKTAQKLAELKNNIEIYEMFEENYVSDPSEMDDQDAAAKTFSMFLSQPSMVDESSVLKNRLLKSGFKGGTASNKSDTIKLFEQHGIKLLPVDESTLVANALKRGQTAVLTEAGKLALKKTEPSFLHNLFQLNSSNPFVQMSSKIVEKEKLRQKSKNSSFESDVNKAKRVKFNDSQLTASTTDVYKSKRVKYNDSQLTTSTTTNAPTSNRSFMTASVESKIQKSRKKNVATMSEETTHVSDSNAKKCQDQEKNIKFLEEQLSLKSQAVKSLTNKLDVSLKLLKGLKTKYEMKEREASLYKIQIQNLLKTLAKKRIG